MIGTHIFIPDIKRMMCSDFCKKENLYWAEVILVFPSSSSSFFLFFLSYWVAASPMVCRNQYVLIISIHSERNWVIHFFFWRVRQTGLIWVSEWFIHSKSKFITGSERWCWIETSKQKLLAPRRANLTINLIHCINTNEVRAAGTQYWHGAWSLSCS